MNVASAVPTTAAPTASVSPAAGPPVAGPPLVGATTTTTSRAPSRIRSAYIKGPVYDWALFLAPPVLALLLGIVLAHTDADDGLVTLSGEQFTWSGLLLGVLIQAHLVIVFFRSHGNGSVLRTHPYRFTVVPAFVLIGCLLWPLFAVTASVLATFWDVYHSGAQTFGFGRIYDAKAGNDPQRGRRLDFVANQLLYAGPIVAGAVMLDHFEDIYEYHDIGVFLFSSIPPAMATHHGVIARTVLGVGALFFAGYVAANVRAYRRGAHVSLQKVWLYASTGAVSLYTWGFNSWGEAFLIMNTFHAVQYFGIVWMSEQRNMSRLFRVDHRPAGKWITLAIFLLLGLGYGFLVEVFVTGDTEIFFALTITVSLMHFWYDGFIWSVRKGKVNA
ncbi:MAG: hypothetical protein AAF715_16155 [Myxococcota bacterium]